MSKCMVCFKPDRDFSHVAVNGREICPDCLETDIGETLYRKERMKEREGQREQKLMCSK